MRLFPLYALYFSKVGRFTSHSNEKNRAHRVFNALYFFVMRSMRSLYGGEYQGKCRMFVSMRSMRSSSCMVLARTPNHVRARLTP